MPTMDSYPAQTTPNDSDYHTINDGVSGETKKITRDDYLSGAPLPDNTVTTASITAANVTTAKIADSAVTFAKTSGIWWEELGRTTLGTAGDTIAVSFTAKKYLQIVILGLPTGGTIETRLQFNSDTGNNYAFSVNTNGSTGAAGSQAVLAIATGASANIQQFIIEVFNQSGQEKGILSRSNEQSGTGAASAPGYRLLYGKWASNTQVSSVQVINAGTADFAIGSEVIVLGHN